MNEILNCFNILNSPLFEFGELVLKQSVTVELFSLKINRQTQTNRTLFFMIITFCFIEHQKSDYTKTKIKIIDS